MSGDTLAQGTVGPETPNENPAVAAKTEASAPMARKHGPAITWIAISLVAVIADRFLKALALQKKVGDFGPVDFRLFKNEGVAFSLPMHPTIFWAVALPIFLVLVWLGVRAWRNREFLRAGMYACIVLGAASNLTDRALYGWTTDYLIFFNRSAVNIADGMIVIGLVAIGWLAGEAHDAAKAKK